jgi:hypothetical protein
MADDQIDDEKQSTLSAGHFDRHGGMFVGGVVLMLSGILVLFLP